MDIRKTADKLIKEHSLSLEEYEALITCEDIEIKEYIRDAAVALRQRIYGNKVYVRGLIEVSSFCKNDCLYCGIRKSNKCAQRYRLGKEDILSCCASGYELGFRTFVMQGGEDAYYTDEILTDIVSEIKRIYPDCAVTLSLGERSFESYKKLFDSGADRYLLRHETADREHYAKLHPSYQSFDERMRCLKDLKQIGYQVGCGFMVGSPYQTAKHIAKDLKFIEEFKPAMCGIGPFITHKDTPFKDEANGSSELTLYLLSVIRLILPAVLLPATTALGTAEMSGREKGILSGANVIMPNLSPDDAREKYNLYDNKLITSAQSMEAMNRLRQSMLSIGYEIVTDRGDVKSFE